MKRNNFNNQYGNNYNYNNDNFNYEEDYRKYKQFSNYDNQNDVYNNNYGNNYNDNYGNNNGNYNQYNTSYNNQFIQTNNFQDYSGNNYNNNYNNNKSFKNKNFNNNNTYNNYNTFNNNKGFNNNFKDQIEQNNLNQYSNNNTKNFNNNNNFKNNTNDGYKTYQKVDKVVEDFGKNVKINNDFNDDKYGFDPNEDAFMEDFDGDDLNDYDNNNDDYNDDNNQFGDLAYEDDFEGNNYSNSKSYGGNQPRYKLEFDSIHGFTDHVGKLIGNEYKKSDYIDDTYVNVLIVAEKPSIARSIAEALSSKSLNQKRVGKGKTLLTFDGYFKNVKAKFTVTSVLGHVYTSDFKSEHNNWSSIEPIELFDVNIVKYEANKKTRIVETLSKLARGKDILSLWLDCDKEGENICYETIYCCYNSMNKKNYQQIYRAKFSSITKNDLKVAFNNMSSLPNKNESSSVDCRQHIDLKIGIAFTRHLTTTVLPALGIETKLLSYGPCQSPTLWFCVNRMREIKGFISKQIFKIIVEFKHGKNKIQIQHDIHSLRHLELKGEDKKYLSKGNSEIIVKYLQSIEKEMLVTSVSKNKQSRNPPVGLNTVNLMKVASSYLKLSPSSTMHLAEKLYTSGYITYPRTESTKYASSFDFVGVLKSIESDGGTADYVSICKQLISNFKKPILRGVDNGDHPPITPSKGGAGLTGDNKRLYDFIASHFVATLMESAEYEETDYVLTLGTETFKASSLTLIKEGFLKLQSWKKESNRTFTNLNIGDKVEVSKVYTDSHWTSPPGHLTESELIGLMEENCIGTDASMSVHIQNIVAREYVKVNSARQMIPTDLGLALISGLESIDEELVKPKIRAEIEKNVDLIAKGKSNYGDILATSLEVYKKKFLLVTQNHDKLIKGFSHFFKISFSKISESLKKIRNIAENEKVKEIKQKR